MNAGSHVLGVGEAADDGVELEADAVAAAPGRDAGELAHGIAAAAADGGVGGFVEGVARHGEDVDVLAVLLEEGLRHPAAVRDDRDGLQVQRFFAVGEHVPEEGAVQERLAAGEVELLHAGLGEEGKAAFGVFFGHAVGGGGGVEAEAARLVALAGEVVDDDIGPAIFEVGGVERSLATVGLPSFFEGRVSMYHVHSVNTAITAESNRGELPSCRRTILSRGNGLSLKRNRIGTVEQCDTAK